MIISMISIGSSTSGHEDVLSAEGPWARSFTELFNFLIDGAVALLGAYRIHNKYVKYTV